MVPVTVTLKEQLAPPASEPPLNTIVSGLLLLSVRVPPHCVLGATTTTSRPVGNVSVKLIPFKVVDELGFVMEKLSVVVLPVKMGFAVKDF